MILDLKGDYVIIISKVNKSFNGKKIIDSLSFHIKSGSITGLIGVNGAGKSTTIKMLSGILKNDSGFIMVDRLNPYRDRKKLAAEISLVSGITSSIDNDIDLKSSLEISKYMYKLNADDYRTNLTLMKNILNIEEILNKKPREMSLGQRMRAEITYSLIHNPKVLFLDEATIGIDVIYKESVLELIKEFNKKNNMTVVFTSNNLYDIEKICSDVIMIDKGRKIYDGMLENLKNLYGDDSIILLELSGDKLPDFDDMPIKKYKISKNRIEIVYSKKIINPSVIINQLMQRCVIKDVKLKDMTLSDIVTKIYLKRG